MKNIITSIGNENIINVLYKIPELNFLNSDILYREGIIEVLEYKKNVDILIISDLIEDDLEIEELINKVLMINNKIKIIYITKNINLSLEKILKNKKIDIIYYNEEIDVNEIIGRLCFDNKRKEVRNQKFDIENDNFEKKHNEEEISLYNNQFVEKSNDRSLIQKNIKKNKIKKRRIRNKIDRIIDFIAKNTWKRKQRYKETPSYISDNDLINYKKNKYKSPKVRTKVINKYNRTIIKIEIN